MVWEHGESVMLRKQILQQPIRVLGPGLVRELPVGSPFPPWTPPQKVTPAGLLCSLDSRVVNQGLLWDSSCLLALCLSGYRSNVTTAVTTTLIRLMSSCHPYRTERSRGTITIC